MSTYWANFVKTGSPNGKGLPAWPAYTTSDNKIMILGEKPGAKTLPDKAALDFMVKRAGGK
jgi:para-nitrobenzyl esterase